MNVQQVIAIITGLIASSVSVCVWAFDTFETKELSRERLARIEQRLDRIESKIDRIIERNGKGH